MNNTNEINEILESLESEKKKPIKKLKFEQLRLDLETNPKEIQIQNLQEENEHLKELLRSIYGSYWSFWVELEEDDYCSEDYIFLKSKRNDYENMLKFWSSKERNEIEQIFKKESNHE